MSRWMKTLRILVAFFFCLAVGGEPYISMAPMALAQQPPPRPSGDDNGDGSNNWLPVVAAVFAAVIVGVLIKWWMGKQKRQGGFVPGEVLAVISLESMEKMRAAGVALADRHRLALREIYPLKAYTLAIMEFSVLDGADPPAKASELEEEPLVLLAQPNFLFHVAAQVGEPAWPASYGLRLIRADRAQSAATGKAVKIALIDTGLDRDHAALKGKVIESFDLTGNGFTPDLHGTLLAGIIAAGHTFRPDIRGVAPEAQIVAIKACQPDKPDRIEAECRSLSLGRALDTAVQSGAKLMNLSVGGPPDKLLSRLVDEAGRRGHILIAAAGNDGSTGPARHPAALDNVIAVTAVDAREDLYSQATRGGFIDLAAPGVEITATAPRDQVRVVSGTSLAAAYVTGTVALLLEHRPELTLQEVQPLLERTAKDLGRLGKDPQFGSGLVDACRAVSELSRQPLCP